MMAEERVKLWKADESHPKESYKVNYKMMYTK